MLSDAKHLWLIGDYASRAIDQRLKARPRGLRPLRCSFGTLRMTQNQVHYEKKRTAR